MRFMFMILYLITASAGVGVCVTDIIYFISNKLKVRQCCFQNRMKNLTYLCCIWLNKGSTLGSDKTLNIFLPKQVNLFNCNLMKKR